MSNKCQGFETTGHHITLVWLIVTTIEHVLLSGTFQPKTLTTIGAAKLHRANIFAEMFTHGSFNLVLTVDTDIVFLQDTLHIWNHIQNMDGKSFGLVTENDESL